MLRSPEIRPIPPGSLISLTYINVVPGQRNAFMQKAGQVFPEAEKAPGMLHRSFKAEGNEFYTLTIWENRESMEVFRDKGKHAEAMREVNTFAKETKFANYTGDKIPTWDEVKEILENINKK